MAPDGDKEARVSVQVLTNEDETQTKSDLPDLKLDKHDLPLVPQQSDHKDDPLNWPRWYKYYVLSLLCLLAFCVQFGAGMVPAAFGPIAKDLHVTHQQASYLTTTYTLLGGLTPLIVTPYVFTLIAIASNIGSAYAATYGTEIVSRVFVGVGASVALAIGAASICDMFFQGERGRFIGFYALALTNGVILLSKVVGQVIDLVQPHFGPIAGGYIALNLGWRWIFKINAIILGVVLLLFILTFPETLFSREEFSNLENRTYWEKMAFRGKVLNRKLEFSDFANNFKMLKYWAIIIPCIYYMTTNTYGSIIFVLTASTITQKLYDFNTAQTGLLLGIPLTLGCLIGESFTGWLSDYLINRYAASHSGDRKPEVRLHLAFLCLFTPLGLIIHGLCVQHETPWIGLAVGMFVASIGVQAGTTLVYSYCTDCYKPQAAEVSTLINLFRQMFAFAVGFYALPFGQGRGFAVSEGTFATINFVTWVPLLFLIWKGEKIRKMQGMPDLHRDL